MQLTSQQGGTSMEPEMMILVRTNLSTSIGVEISYNATIGDLLSGSALFSLRLCLFWITLIVR